MKKTRDAGIKQVDLLQAKGSVIDSKRIEALYEMLVSFATMMSARPLIPFADRAKAARSVEDLEVVKAEFQKELDKHR